MQRRAIRVTLLIVLITTGLAAAYLTWDGYRRLAAALDGHRALDMRVDAMLTAVADLAAAQQAYVIPGQPDDLWLARVSSLFQRLYDDVAAARTQAQSAEDDDALDAFSERLDALMKVDARARQDLRLEQELMAADLLLTEGHETLSSMNAGLRSWQDRERTRAASATDSFAARSAAALGGAATLWLMGLIVLFRAPGASSPFDVAQGGPFDCAQGRPLPVSEQVVPTLPETNLDPAQGRPLDLAGAAAACSQLARLTDAAALPAVLAQAADVLDASGIIVWLGAGEQLFAVMAHGYDARLVARLGPINRCAENATAAAWRHAEMRTVPGDVMANGAVVAPMVGPSGCLGVLAIEVRNQREADTATRAVASILAAQLAGIVAAWPAASARETPGENPASATA